MKKNNNNICDNKKMEKELVKKIYNNIFRLDTKTLEQHNLKVFEELIKRKDYCELNFLISKYRVLRYELISRGVDLND